MTINLEFSKFISKKDVNFVIFLTKLSELQLIRNLPFDYKIIAGASNSKSNLDNNKNVEYFLQSKLFKKFINVSIILIKNPKKGFIRKLSSEEVKKYEEREQRLIKEGKRKK